jgi:hypothetical protein
VGEWSALDNTSFTLITQKYHFLTLPLPSGMKLGIITAAEHSAELGNGKCKKSRGMEKD